MNYQLTSHAFFFSSSFRTQMYVKITCKTITHSRDGSVDANTREVNQRAFVMKCQPYLWITDCDKQETLGQWCKEEENKTVNSIEELVFILRSWHFQQNIISQWPNAIHCFASELTWIHSTSCENIYWYFFSFLLNMINMHTSSQIKYFFICYQAITEKKKLHVIFIKGIANNI